MVPMTAELRMFVDIDATPERVWQVLIDLPAYPQWNPFITSAEGPLVVGGRVSITLLPLNALLRVTLSATVVEVVACRRLRFRLRWARLGIPGLFDIDYTLTLTPQEGGVRLWEDAQFRGLLVFPLTRPVNRDASLAFDAMNTALKSRTEGMQPTRP